MKSSVALNSLIVKWPVFGCYWRISVIANGEMIIEYFGIANFSFLIRLSASFIFDCYFSSNIFDFFCLSVLGI